METEGGREVGRRGEERKWREKGVGRMCVKKEGKKKDGEEGGGGKKGATMEARIERMDGAGEGEKNGVGEERGRG